MYHGSRKGKTRCSVTPCDSPCTKPEELSPSKGLGVHSLLFQDEEEAIRAVSVGNKTIERIRNTEKESKESRLIVMEKINLELKAQRSKRRI